MEIKKSFLIITNELPVDNSGGANIRNFEMVRWLSKFYNVTLLTSIADDYQKKHLKDFENICEVIVAPFLFNKYKVFILKKSLKKLLKKKSFDFIQVEHSEFGKVLKGIKTNSIKILDFHNVNTYAIGGEKIKNFEKELSSIYDIVLCCSEIEKERLKELAYKIIIVVPNGVNLEYFNYKKTIKEERTILFIGRLKYGPNIEGLQYFIQKVFPLLNGKIKFNVVGEYNKKDFKNIGENIKFYGFIEDIRPFLNNTILICPVLNGGGTRLKILTAFASGTPVVSTLKGAEGINYQDGENILIADSPEEFQGKIFQLLNDKSFFEKISKNARKLVEEKYAWKSIMENYKNEIEKS